MDLRDIEAWGRELLEHEAAKRGIRSPEVYSRTDLVRLILKHDYGAPRNVREAARLIGGILGSAREVLKKRLNPLHGAGVRTSAGAARQVERDARRAPDAAKPAADVPAAEPPPPPGAGAGASVHELESARREKAAAEERNLIGTNLPSAGESEILERSYVGDRNLDLPAAAKSSAAAERGTLDREHSYVGGRKLDLPPEEVDALREAEQIRAEARDLRKESERVRSDARAAAHLDSEGPVPGWHEATLGADLPPSAAKPVESDEAPSVEARDDSRGSDEARDEATERMTESRQARDDAAARSLHESAAALGDALPRTPDDATSRGESLPIAAVAPSRTPASAADAPVPHLRLVEPLPPSRDEMHAPSPEAAANAPGAPEPAEQLAYGPHPQDGLLLRWRVTSEAVERARQLLGSRGELAVRIVAVRVEPHAVVKTDVIDHGPIAEAGDWTAPLLPSEAKYVSAIGLRSANKFVSIVHARS